HLLHGTSPSGDGQLPDEAMELGVPEWLARLCRDGEAGCHRRLRRGKLTCRVLRLGEEPEERGRADWPPRLACQREPVRDRDLRARIACRHARGGVPRPPEAEPQREALGLAQRDHLFRPLLLPHMVAPRPMDGGLEEEREGQTEWM